MYTLKDPSHSGDSDGMVAAGPGCRIVGAEREIPSLFACRVYRQCVFGEPLE